MGKYAKLQLQLKDVEEAATVLGSLTSMKDLLEDKWKVSLLGLGFKV